MSLMAQNLLSTPYKRSEAEKMDNTQVKAAIQADNYLSENIKISGALVNTAQETLTDLDRSIMELAALVEGLRHQSKKLNVKTL